LSNPEFRPDVRPDTREQPFPGLSQAVIFRFYHLLQDQELASL